MPAKSSKDSKMPRKFEAHPILGKISLFLFAIFLCAPAYSEQSKIHIRTLPFEQVSKNKVKTLGIWELTLNDENFGGFSGLALNSAGNLIAVTDRGVLFFLQPAFKDQDILKSLRVLNSAFLQNHDGTIFFTKRQRDAESLALDQNGALWVSFEQDHRVQAYDPSTRLLKPRMDLPGQIKALSGNAGFEAMEFSVSNDLLLITESKSSLGFSPVWVKRNGTQSWIEAKLPHIDNYRPTGLAQIPGYNEMLLLERFYSPPTDVRARLYLFDPVSLKRTALLGGFRSPNPIDNYEAIVARKTSSGDIHIFILADDNFSLIQRTLMMQVVYRP